MDDERAAWEREADGLKVSCRVAILRASFLKSDKYTVFIAIYNGGTYKIQVLDVNPIVKSPGSKENSTLQPLLALANAEDLSISRSAAPRVSP